MNSLCIHVLASDQVYRPSACILPMDSIAFDLILSEYMVDMDIRPFACIYSSCDLDNAYQWFRMLVEGSK